MEHDPRTRAAPDSYSSLQKILHWSVAALIALQYLVFDRMGGAFKALVEQRAGAWTVTSVAHILIGTTILALVLLRLSLRVRRGVPVAPDQEPSWAGLLARTVHWLFYGLLIALPLLGLTAWFGSSEQAAALHESATSVLIWVIALHIVGVLVHVVWWRSGLLRRIV